MALPNTLGELTVKNEYVLKVTTTAVGKCTIFLLRKKREEEGKMKKKPEAGRDDTLL